jgi:hypothetical protein
MMQEAKCPAQEESPLETTPKKKVIEPLSSIVTPTTTAPPPNNTPELRRSNRCPKKKPVTIVEATMACERDAERQNEPFFEACTVCGEEFNKKYLFIKHARTHKPKSPSKKVVKTESSPQPIFNITKKPKTAAEARQLRAQLQALQQQSFCPEKSKSPSPSRRLPSSPLKDGHAQEFNVNGEDADADVGQQENVDGGVNNNDNQDQQYEDYEDYEDYDEEEEQIMDENGESSQIVGYRLKSSFSSQASQAMANPVTCSICQMTFTRRAHLNRHMMLHMGVSIYS